MVISTTLFWEFVVLQVCSMSAQVREAVALRPQDLPAQHFGLDDDDPTHPEEGDEMGPKLMQARNRAFAENHDVRQ